MLLFVVVISYGAAATGDPVLINEVLASHSSTDDTEFLEFYGDPGQSLDGLSFIVVEGDSFGPGKIDRRFDFKPFHVIGANGFFLAGNCVGLADNYSTIPDASIFTNYFENSSLTIALVETASLVGDSVSGSEVVLSAVALSDGDAGDVFYFDAPVIGPDGPFYPAGARRIADGVDTGSAADWAIAVFFLPGANTPTGGGFDGCSTIQLTIPEIQGDDRYSPYQGEIVETTGIVTQISANGRDMWIQDPVGDGDPATSDGIFVDDRDKLDPQPEIGDYVMITGEVEEQQFGNALPLTRIDDPDDFPFEIISSGNDLPAPVELNNLPEVEMPDGEAFWEPLEGMLVKIENAPVIAATNRFGEFGMLAKNNAKPRSGFFDQTQQIIAQTLGKDHVDYNPERIMVDDATLDDPIQVMPGDRVRVLTGVVDYTFSMYKLQPYEPADGDIFNHNMPKMPVSKRWGEKGDLVITTYNVENLFDLVNNPDKDDGSSTPTADELDTQLAKLALSIEVELNLPEILVVQEVENTEILQELGDLVNAANGTSYEACSFETSDGRGIEVGFLWDMDRVDLQDCYQMTGTGVEDWFGPGSPSPGREPLVGVFDYNSMEITIIGNHFKSKGGDDPLYGVNWPADRVTEFQRKGQAGVVRAFVDSIFDADPDALVMVAGDLNDFQFMEPGESDLPEDDPDFEQDHPVGIVEGWSGQVPLFNLVNVEKPAELYTFVFDGNSQVLDHILISPSLLDYFAGVNILHFNAGYPAELGEDTTTTLRASDHDPIEARFNFEANGNK
jgi:predicted extracellular nuclease